MSEAPASRPDVSVVIPCYNAERWVGRAIDGVLSQKGMSVEVIIIDDGSTDNSLGVLRGYGQRIHWETGPNQGACTARNRGLELAHAEYVMFLDADDYISSDFLAYLQIAMVKAKADFGLGPVLDASEHGNTQLRASPRTDDWRTLLVDWLDGKFVPPCGVLWRTSYIRQIGGWNTHLRKNQDGELVYRALLHHPRLAETDQGYGTYFHHSGERITSSASPEKILDKLSTIKFLTERLCESNQLDASLWAAISRASHRVEINAAKHGLRTAEREIRDFRAALQFPRHEGAWRHVLLCKLIGLSNKERISYAVSKIFTHRYR